MESFDGDYLIGEPENMFVRQQKEKCYVCKRNIFYNEKMDTSNKKKLICAVCFIKMRDRT